MNIIFKQSNANSFTQYRNNSGTVGLIVGNLNEDSITTTKH